MHNCFIMRYGIGYKGSKNKLTVKINNLFPKKNNFYDLFCGGGAITHRALIENKFNNYYMNDLNPLCTDIFINAVKGKYRNETRWISRSEFEEKKETDPLVAFCYSFGNDLKTYLYAEETEDFKRAYHYAVVNNDLEGLKKYIPTLPECNETEIKERRLFYMAFIKKMKKAENNPSESLERLQHLESLERLENLERLNNLESMDSSVRLNKLKVSNKSYEEIEILPDSVVYCDIPYENTDGYLDKNFDFHRFYEWASEQKELLFISSYKMPSDRFECIADFSHRSILAIGGNNEVIERVFIPRHQIDLYKKQQVQPSLFEELW